MPRTATSRMTSGPSAHLAKPKPQDRIQLLTRRFMQRATALTKEASPKATVPVRSTRWRSRLLQRKCACGGTPGPTGECEGCRRKRLQRKASQPSTINSQPAEVPPIVHEVPSPGQALDAAHRALTEPRFGRDFTQLRVGSDDTTADSAQAVNVMARQIDRGFTI